MYISFLILSTYVEKFFAVGLSRGLEQEEESWRDDAFLGAARWWSLAHVVERTGLDGRTDMRLYALPLFCMQTLRIIMNKAQFHYNDAVAQSLHTHGECD